MMMPFFADANLRCRWQNRGMNPTFFIRANGDRIDYFDSGTGSDLLIYHHGTPAAGPLHDDILVPAAANDLRIVELVRPGYGHSTRVSGRSVAHIAHIAHELAEHLGFSRYVTMGWSGGGPHSLATVALYPHACVAAMSLAGVAPFDADGLNFLEGMGQDNHEEFGAALAGESEIRNFLSAIEEQMKVITGSQIIDMMSSLLPDEDRAVLTGEYADDEAEIFRWAVSTGVDGWLDDDIAFTQPWGFEVNGILNPVTIWQGDTDLMVPTSHGRWLIAQLPNVDANLVQGHGHLSIASLAFDQGFSWLKSKLTDA